MAKPKAIQRLEEQTGETIAYTPDVIVSQDRHLCRSAMPAALRRVWMRWRPGVGSRCRIREGVARRGLSPRATVVKLDGQALTDRLAADVAEVRRRLAG